MLCSDQLAGWLSIRAAVWLHGHKSSSGSNPNRLKIFFSSVPAPHPRGAGFVFDSASGLSSTMGGSTPSTSTAVSSLDSDRLAEADSVAESAFAQSSHVSPASDLPDGGRTMDCSSFTRSLCAMSAGPGRSGFERWGLVLADCGVSSTSVSRIRLFISVNRSQPSQVKLDSNKPVFRCKMTTPTADTQIFWT